MKEETALVTLTPTDSLELDDFWERFHIFASPVEEFCFRHWYIVFFGYCLLLGLLDLLLDVRQGMDFSFIFSHSGNYDGPLFSWVKSDATNVQLLSEGAGLLLVMLTFRFWCSRIAPLFQYFYDMGRICSADSADKVNQKEYALFLDEYQRALSSRKRYILLGFLLLIVVGLMLLIILPRMAGIVAHLGTDGFYVSLALIRWPGLLIVLSGTALACYMATGCWVMVVTGWYIRKLTTEFHLVIQPRHPDNCGGLKKLGDFCLGMALPILIGSLFLGVYGIGFALTKTGGGFVVIASNVFLFLLALPLAAIAFFVPLWSIHQRMLEQKQESEENFAYRVTNLEKRIYNHLGKGEVEKAKSAKDELEVIQMLRPENVEYPLWPFDRRIFLTYLVPHIVPLISLIVGANSDGPLASVLKAVLSFFTGSAS